MADDPEVEVQIAAYVPLLLAAYRDGDESFYELLPRVWTLPRYPSDIAELRRLWKPMWRRFGKDRASEEGVPVFRGAVATSRDGLAWSTHIEKARCFAWSCLQDPDRPAKVAHVYQALTTYRAVLFFFDWNPGVDHRLGEGEVILDPRSLTTGPKKVQTVRRDGDPGERGEYPVRWSEYPPDQ